MYTIYNVTRQHPQSEPTQSHDIIWWNPDGTVASVWCGDGTYFGEFGLIQSNFLNKVIVRATVLATVVFDKILKY